MNKKIVFGVALVALATLVMAPSASAACAGIRSANTYNGIEPGQSYWTPTSGAGTLVGQVWQLGAPATFSTGNCAGFLYFSTGGVNLNLEMSSCGAGCPANGSTLAVLAQNQVPPVVAPPTPGYTEFLLATIVETPARSVNYDYSAQGNHAFVRIPKPRVLSSSRAGANVNLSVAIDSIAAGLYGPNAASGVTGFRVLAAPAVADPGRAASAYASVATVTSAGGTGGTTPVTVDCTDITKSQWLVTQIQFENGSVLGDAVSQAVRVNCNPALADPKYKIVPKKGMGTGTIKN